MNDPNIYDANKNIVGQSSPAQQSAPTVVQPPPVPVSPTKDKDDYIRTLANNYFQSLASQPDNTRQAFEQYLSSSQQSPQEIAAGQHLDSILGARDLGIANVRAKPIPMPFITGQSQNIQEQANAQAMIAERQLGRLQEERLIQSDIAKARFEYEQALADRASEQTIQAAKSRLDFELAMYEQMKAEQAQSQEQQLASQDFSIEKGIQQPLYRIGNTIYDSRTRQPKYEDVGGEYRRLADGFRFSSEQQFFADSGITSWDQIQQVQSQPDLSQYPNSYQEYLLSVQSGYQGDYNSWLTEDANRKRSVGGGSTTIIGGLSTPQFNRLNTIADNARQDASIKTFPEVRASYETAKAAAQQGGGAGDIVLMRMIAKITDPASAVREEEFKTFQGAQGTLARYGIQLTKQMWDGTQLTTAGRQALLQQVEGIYQQRKAAYDQATQFYTSQADSVAPGQGSSIIPYYTAPSGGGQNSDPLGIR